VHSAIGTTAYESQQVLKVVEKEGKDIKFNFQDHLLGGVRLETLKTCAIAEKLHRLRSTLAVSL